MTSEAEKRMKKIIIFLGVFCMSSLSYGQLNTEACDKLRNMQKNYERYLAWALKGEFAEKDVNYDDFFKAMSYLVTINHLFDRYCEGK